MLRSLCVSAAATALTACGGGGDGSDRSSGAGASSATASTPPVNTGLRTPTLPIPHTLTGAIYLVQEVVQPYAAAEWAQATKALGAMVPGMGNATAAAYNCSSGQIALETDATGGLTYTYSDCFNGTFTFNGTSLATPAIDADGIVKDYQLRFSGLHVSGPAGVATAVSGSIDCMPPASAGQPPSCISHFGGFFWGHDFTYESNGTANGSIQCDASIDWHVVFKDFSATSGVAELFGPNGSAVVTRTGAKTFTVAILVDAVLRSYDVTLP